MNVWIAMKGALTVMDLVTRGWARQLEIDECGVMVLMRLGFLESASAAKLALLCGRVRQQVQRSLGILAKAGLAEPCAVSDRGLASAWSLTEKGKRRWRSLSRAVRAWEEELERAIDVPQLTEALGRVVEMAVNRPSADGWRKGLIEPHELKKVPLGYAISIEDELLEMSATEGSIDGDEMARRDRERERAEREWHSMWMRLNA